jgi:hypothetical protein
MAAMKFIWEQWREKAEYELGASMSFGSREEELALEYFSDGKEPWDFANALEDMWLASQQVY